MARLRSMLALNAPTSSPAMAMPSVVELAATPISDGITPYSTARLGRIACVANRSTNVRKPITAISSERPGESLGMAGAIAWLGAVDMWPTLDKVASRRGLGGTPGCRPIGGDGRRGERLFAVEHVRRQENRRLVAVVDPVVRNAIGLAADVTGVMVDRGRAIGAIFGDGAADRDDQRRAIGMAMQRDDSARLDDQPAGAQLRAVNANFLAQVDRADNGVGDVLGHGRGVGERIDARGLALTGHRRAGAKRGDGNDAGRDGRLGKIEHCRLLKCNLGVVGGQAMGGINVVPGRHRLSPAPDVLSK